MSPQPGAYAPGLLQLTEPYSVTMLGLPGVFTREPSPLKAARSPSLSKFPRWPPPAHTGRVGSSSFTSAMSLEHSSLDSCACWVKNGSLLMLQMTMEGWFRNCSTISLTWRMQLSSKAARSFSSEG